MSLFRNRIISPLLVPNGLLFALLAYGLTRPSLPEAWQPFLEIAPTAVLGVALLLGWRFNRSRLIYACGLFVLAGLCLVALPDRYDSSLIRPLVLIFLPLNLFLVSCLREKGLLSLGGSVFLGILGGEVLLCGWLLDQHPARVETWLSLRLVEWPALASLSLGQPQLLINILVLLLMAWRAVRLHGAFETGFFWAQLLLLFGFSFPMSQPLPLLLAAAGGILVLGLLETSHALAYRDELTGLPGRRALNEALAKQGRRCTVAMLDIDHFKKFNDIHGHDVGDQVLRMVASKLTTVGGGGRVFRYGGEEFAMIFPRQSLKGALPFLDQVRQVVEEARFIPRGKDRPRKKPKQRPKKAQKYTALQVTISIGVAERTERKMSNEQLLKGADQALYRAKKAGRNRVSQ